MEQGQISGERERETLLKFHDFIIPLLRLEREGEREGGS